MAGQIRTRRWNEPAEPGDGLRILITRFRPRGVPKNQETWDQWDRRFAPSPELVKKYKGKSGLPLTWEVYRAIYLRQMKEQSEALDSLARQVAGGQTITLLCSSSCLRESRCHRSLLRDLLEKRLASLPPGGASLVPPAPNPRYPSV